MAKIIYALVEEVYSGDDRFALMRDSCLSKETLYKNLVSAQEALVSLYMQNRNKAYLGVPVQYKDLWDHTGTIIYRNEDREIHRFFSIEKREAY